MFIGSKLAHPHFCRERCKTCNYYCEKSFGHEGKCHTVHGNMTSTIFASIKETMDIKFKSDTHFSSTTVNENNEEMEEKKDDDQELNKIRVYDVGESTRAELCNYFCKKLGRGHVHLEICKAYNTNKKCQENKHRRHEKQKWYPNPEIPKGNLKKTKNIFYFG